MSVFVHRDDGFYVVIVCLFLIGLGGTFGRSGVAEIRR